MGVFRRKNTPYGGRFQPEGLNLREKNTPYGGISPKKYPLWAGKSENISPI